MIHIVNVCTVLHNLMATGIFTGLFNYSTSSIKCQIILWTLRDLQPPQSGIGLSPETCEWEMRSTVVDVDLWKHYWTFAFGIWVIVRCRNYEIE